MMPMWRRSIKIWNHIIGDFFDILCSNLRKAVRTQNYAVLDFSTPALLNGNSGNRLLFRACPEIASGSPVAQDWPP